MNKKVLYLFFSRAVPSDEINYENKTFIVLEEQKYQTTWNFSLKNWEISTFCLFIYSVNRRPHSLEVDSNKTPAEQQDSFRQTISQGQGSNLDLLSLRWAHCRLEIE